MCDDGTLRSIHKPNLKRLASFAPKIWPGPQKVEMGQSCEENVSREPDHIPFRDDFSGWDLLPLTYRPNLKFLPTVITIIWRAVQNVCIGGSLGHLGVAQGHLQCHHAIR